MTFRAIYKLMVIKKCSRPLSMHNCILRILCMKELAVKVLLWNSLFAPRNIVELETKNISLLLELA